MILPPRSINAKLFDRVTPAVPTHGASGVGWAHSPVWRSLLHTSSLRRLPTVHKSFSQRYYWRSRIGRSHACIVQSKQCGKTFTCRRRPIQAAFRHCRKARVALYPYTICTALGFLVSMPSNGGMVKPTHLPHRKVQGMQRLRRQELDPDARPRITRTTDYDGDPVTAIVAPVSTRYDDDGDPSTTLVRTLSTLEGNRASIRSISRSIKSDGMFTATDEDGDPIMTPSSTSSSSTGTITATDGAGRISSSSITQTSPSPTSTSSVSSTSSSSRSSSRSSSSSSSSSSS